MPFTERLESNMGGQVRVHTPELSDKLLGPNSRAHVIKYCGFVGEVPQRPLVIEMINEHGKAGAMAATEIIDNGGSARMLGVGDEYAVVNNDPILPKGMDCWLARVHKHPDSV